MKPLPYLPGTRPANPGLLSRFLPPLEDGTAAAWLMSRIPAGSWILDPFGSSPRLVLEGARAGYRVLVTANNPIARFLIEMAASAPSEAELKAALADLAAARKSDERLETHLQALYLTACEKCGAQIPARAFLWNKDSDAPYARVYECPQCEDAGERPAQPEDQERARQMTRSAQLHRSRVLERVAPPGDPDREYAEEALQVYLPRAIYALATLINRIEGLDVVPERRRLITALALAAFDAGNSLWSIDRQRPKRLSVPGQFRERNIWLALEHAVGQWSETSSKVPMEAWPNKIPEGGICLFDGRLKTLAAEVRKEIPIRAVVAAVPRPNQAFWSLSSLWAGWLWGREAAEPFKVGLRRRRYDWAWNATALSSAFKNLAALLPEGTPMLGLLGEPEAAFATSTLTAADSSGFQLEGLALRDEQDPLQVVWTQTDAPRPASKRELKSVRRSIDEHLNQRAEPTPYLHLHTAAVAHLAVIGALKAPDEELEDALRSNNALIEAAVTTDARFAHYGQGEGLETGMWGLYAYDTSADSLADQVEMAAVQSLQKNPDRIFLEIEQGLNEQFPGLLTPSKGLIYNVLYSYAWREGGVWRLRAEDIPANRREDLEQMIALLELVGQRLGFQTREQDGAVLWEERGATERVFFVIASALVGRVVKNNIHPPEKCVIVLPGGRASLAAYKQQRDPALAERMREWRLLKFRLLRSLADIPVLNRQTFEEQITSDPVEQAQGQLMMF
jgi:hypothetical protein